MRTKATIELVIVASDGAFLLWDARGTNYVATDREALARWVLEVAADENTPTVEFGAPKGGAWVVAATRVLDAVTRKAEKVEDAVGVHVVIQWSSDPWSTVVWAPRGGPRAALNPLKLGELLADIAVDSAQPRVPAGAPPDPGEQIVDGLGQVVSQWLRPGGSAA